MKKEESKKFRFSISLKITIVVVFVLLIATSIGTYIEYLNDKELFFNECESSTNKIAVGLSGTADYLIKNNKISSLQIMLEHVANGERCSSCHIKMKKMGVKQLLFEDRGMIGTSTMDVFVVTRDFTVVAASQKNLIGEKLGPLLQEKKWRNLKAFRNIKEVMLNGRAKSEMDYEDLSHEVIIPFKGEESHKDINGVVFVTKDLVQVRKKFFLAFLRIFTSLILLSSFIGVCFFIALRKIITEPLKKLTQRAKIIGEGKKPEHLCLNTRDELGFLCKTFNEMVETIVQREDDILKRNRMTNSLYEISSLISTTLNIQEVLDISLKKVIEILGVDGGGIFLFDESSYSLKIKTSCGFSEEFVNSVRSLKADDGLVGKAFTTGETIALEEIRNIPRSTLEAVKKEGFKAGAYVPLKAKKDKVLGVMAIVSKDDKKFSNEEIPLLSSIGELMGIAVENALLYENSKQKVTQIEMINNIGKLINEIHSVDEISRLVAEQIPEIISFDVGGIHLLEAFKKRLNFIYLIKDKVVILKKKIDIPMEGTAFNWGVMEKKSLLRKDLKEEALFRGEISMFEKFGIRSMMTTPLISKEEVIGFLSVGRQEPNSYTEEDLKLFEVISREIATSIHNAKLFGNITRAKKEWENTFDSMSDLISIHDKEFNILRVNKGLANKFNIKPEELIGKKCYELFHCNKEPLRSCPHIKTIDTGKYCEEEIEGKGLLEQRTFSVSTSPIFDSGGKIIGSVHVMRDITEKKIAEKELVESNEKLKETLQRLEITQEQLLQADKLAAVGQLVSGVAHELNNPLTSVIGYSQLLMKKEKEESLRSDAEKVFNEANRAAKIVGNLLAFARQKKPEKRYIDINEALKKTIELRSYEMKVSNIELVEELDNNLPKTMADFQQLQQVFLNIMINAEQAMLESNKGGRLVVKTEVVKEKQSAVSGQHSAKGGEFIRISFRDNGAGIPEKNLKKIFDPFFTTKAVGKGTGLGLSLSYGIIEEHDGKIYAKNNLDKGVTFFVEVPVIEGVANPIIKEVFNETMLTTSKRILVVDDEEVIRSLLKEILVSKGCEVELAQNGNEAVNKIKRKSYDLIVSDIKMPALDGKELYNLLRVENPYLASRIIFITGDTVNPETISFLQKSGNFFLKKPFQSKDLLKAVEESFIRNVH